MSLVDQIFSLVSSLLQSSGYYGVFVLMVMESATLPIPSELVLPFAGYLVFLGKINFWLTLGVASVGSLVGTMIDYLIGYSVGRAAVLRYGRAVRLNEDHLKTAENWLDGRGEVAVLLARFVPLIRTLIAFPAGITRMQTWRFIAFSAAGILVWDGLLMYLGVAAGQNSSLVISRLTSAFTPIEIIAAAASAVILGLLLRRRRAGSGAETSGTASLNGDT